MPPSARAQPRESWGGGGGGTWWGQAETSRELRELREQVAVIDTRLEALERTVTRALERAESHAATPGHTVMTERFTALERRVSALEAGK